MADDLTPDQLADLQAELDHLEATDPAVADAAARYDAMSAKIRSRPLSCGCPPEHHDEAVRRAADPAERRALLARLTQQALELGTYDKRVTPEREEES